MANTPNMNLALPIVSTTLGPQWASMIDAAFSAVDSHDHSSGKGVQVPSAGVNVNQDLPFHSFNATGLRTARFSDVTNPLAAPADVGCLYLASGDLYWNSGAGAQVRITSGGGLAGTPGSISGLASPAAVTYTPAQTSFRFTSASNANAALDAGAITVRSTAVTGANGITIQSPAGLGANYSMTLPAALPAGQRFMTLDNLGNVAAPWNVDAASLEVAANILQVKDLGISTAKIANAAVTRAKLSAAGPVISASSGSFSTASTGIVDVTNLSVTITTTGAPVILMLISANDGGATYFGNDTTHTQELFIYRGAGSIAYWFQDNSHIALSLLTLDQPAAGTYTYSVKTRTNGGQGFVNSYKLVAYEL